MKSKILLVTAWMFLIAITVISCKKEASDQNTKVSEDAAITMSEETTEAEADDDDVTELGLSVGADLEVADTSEEPAAPNTADGFKTGIRIELFVDLAFKIGPCTKIDISPRGNVYPKTVTIDYGDGCVCFDGKFRKGAVILVFSAPIRRPGAVLTITLRDFYVNRKHIEGVKTIKNLTENSAIKYSVQVEGGKISFPNGRGFTVDRIKTVSQVRGMDTRTIRDDVYEIVGRSKISYANGLTIIKNTETPLVKKVTCAWISQGILKIVINDRTLYLDFGNGDCDNKAILTWSNNGKREITLP
jgi:hypothetical protein